MQKRLPHRLLAVLLSAALLLSCAAAVFALEPWELQWTLKWTVPNVKVENKVCAAMQGMASADNYIYTAKTGASDTYCVLTRTDMDTGAQKQLSFYESTSAQTATPCKVLSHANDMTAVKYGSKTMLFVATVQKGTALARLKVSGAKAYLTGWFKLLRADGSTPLAASSVTYVGDSGGKWLFLLKNGLYFYGCAIDKKATGGTADAPAPVVCPRLFEIDTRNAQFWNADGTTYRVDNLETWINQDCTLDPDTNILYVPLGNGVNDNVIILYDASPFVTPDAMTAAADSDTVLFPCNVSFRLYEPSLREFEIESCDFRDGQGENGDLLLYFNNNASNISYEGIYVTNYAKNSLTLSPLVTGSTVVYTVKYKANGGQQNAALDSWNRMNATRHLGGVSTRLRPNTFLAPAAGYTFTGWNLYRSSDKRWLYERADGTLKWHRTGKQPEGAVRALLTDRTLVTDLSKTNGDTIAAYAQWEAPRYTVTFDPAGGEASFDSKILHTGDVYGPLPEAVLEGMQFDGWFLPDGAAVTEETVFTSEANVTVTARWSELPPPVEEPTEPEAQPEPEAPAPYDPLGILAFFRRIGDWFRSVFEPLRSMTF